MTAAGPDPAAGANPTLVRRGRRRLLLVVGMVLTGVGAAGLVLPLLPGTVLLILAAWCFANSSERFHTWLYTHPRLGPPIRDWYAHRAIPVRAKILAVTMMTASWAYVTFVVARDWILPMIVGAILLAVAAYLVTRPSGPAERG